MMNWQEKLQEYYTMDFGKVEPFGDGHIHQTFKIAAYEKSYIVQKFNTKVFPFADRIAQNHKLLLQHNIQASLSFDLPLAIPNKSGDLFTRLGSDTFRVAPFVSGHCINEVEHPFLAEIAAKAFAELIVAGKKIEASSLQEVIPDFNNLSLRYKQLQMAIEQTNLKIEGDLADLVNFYLQQDSLVKEYDYWIARLPLRLTHNDTKINNLIYAEDMNKVNAVIDLDTLMGGYVFYDFGDLVRTVACTQGESSQSWDEIKVDRIKYQALKSGFLEAGKDLFTDDEIASLDFGGKMMTCIMGLRFLADFLNGNIYYTIHYKEQNYHRAKNQMMLLKGLSL